MLDTFIYLYKFFLLNIFSFQKKSFPWNFKLKTDRRYFFNGLQCLRGWKFAALRIIVIRGKLERKYRRRE